MPKTSTRIVFLVNAHQLPHQLARLVSRIAVNGHSVVIHVDRKTNHRVYAEMVERCSVHPGVRFLPTRCRIFWADFSQVRATLMQLRDAIDNHPDFEYAVTLSGQCYPAMSIDDIERSLRALAGASQIESRRLPVPDWGNGMAHMQDPTFRIFRNRRFGPRPNARGPLDKLVRLAMPRRPVPANLPPQKGLAFWALQHDAVRCVLKTVDDRPELIRHFARCVMPDEMFFASIMAGSGLPFKNEPITYANFQNMRARPETLTINDLGAIRASRKLFARKFDERIDAEVLDALDALAADAPTAAPPR